MDFSTEGIAILVVFAVGGRLAHLYLERLDAKTADDPEAKRRAIAASRRRAQGHLWLLGALMTALVALLLPFSLSLPTGTAIAVVLATLAASAVCVVSMARAYGESRRIG